MQLLLRLSMMWMKTLVQLFMILWIALTQRMPASIKVMNYLDQMLENSVVAMSLSAIAYKEIKCMNIWNQTTLNAIMVCGNNLHSIISQSINKDYFIINRCTRVC